MNKRKLTNKRRRAALRYAKLGWHVLPLHGISNGRCTCGKPDCSSPGKHPRLQNGYKVASKNRKQITRWWKQWPDANVGVCTGVKSGVVVLDIDPRNGGDKSLAKLVKEHGPLPATLHVKTGGWSGDAKSLLDKLSKKTFSNLQTRMRYDWPKTPRGMGGALRRLAPSLRSLGVNVEFLGKTGRSGTRLIRLGKSANQPPAPPAKSPKIKTKRRKR